jgi:hypothetical protein
MVYVLETKLRESALQRHLTTFEADLVLVTGTSLCTLVTTGGSATETTAGTASETTARVSGTCCGFEII